MFIAVGIFALIIEASGLTSIWERYPPVEGVVKNQIDHFRFTSSIRGSKTGNDVFDQKYLYFDGFWNNDNTTEDRSGPLLVYFGNEGKIEDFYNASGAIFEIAQELKAMVVFVEHRYYGQSLPFGNASFSAQNLVYLTVEQALADMAVFLSQTPTLFQSVLFGGSYGGMLAAWFRIKYPHLSRGAIAASAPVDTYLGENRAQQFLNATLHVYRRYGGDDDDDDATVGEKCASLLEDALQLIPSLSNSSTGLRQISKAMQTCEPLKTKNDADRTAFYALGSLATLAMLDYPYAADFVVPLPANPVKTACSVALERHVSLSTGPSSARLLGALNAAINVFVNSTGSLECHNVSKELLGQEQPLRSLVAAANSNQNSKTNNNGSTPGLLGDISTLWNYQACAEMVLEPLTSDGLGFAIETDSQVAGVVERCRTRFRGLEPRIEWLRQSFGNGAQISQNARNIVFSDGEKDPWRVGGVPENAQELSPDNSVIHIFIEGAAHHQDLRSSDPRDSLALRKARKVELENIKKWLGY
eukprot:jgi/Bigna1/72016/fgenesh1_pg.18_\